MTKRLTRATIDLSLYSRNLSRIRHIIGDSTALMAVIKANAYGHGIEQIAQAAKSQGADYLGVVSIGELMQVRQHGIRTPCLILNYLDEASIGQAISLQASVTAMDEAFIVAAQRAASAADVILKIHLKIDSGMHRAGCNPEDALRLAQLITDSNNLLLEGVFTHFADSDNPDPSFAQQQLETFKHCLSSLANANIRPRFVHAANSGAILALPDSHFSMVRAGIISYGINPLPPHHPLYDKAEQFSPILQLHSRIALVRTVPRGESIGYNRTWRAQRESQIALVPIGYGDGFRRSPRHAPRVIVRGGYAPVVGAISMDQITIDVTDICGVQPGDTVTIIGQEGEAAITVNDTARDSETIAYEVLTNISDRVERHYVANNKSL